MHPKVSVLIVTYNYGKFIKECIDSVLNQTYKDYEIIVVDDGSTDNTRELVKEYKTIRYIYQENKGISFARNAAIKEAKGEWIAFIDADDRWPPDRLKALMTYYNNALNAKVIIGKYYNFSDNEKVLTLEQKRLEEKCEKEHLTAAMLKKDLFFQYGGFNESLRYGEDIDLMFRLIKEKIQFHYIDNDVLHRRIHDKNVSLTESKEEGNLIYKAMFDTIRKARINQNE